MKTEVKHPLLKLAEEKLPKRALGYFRIIFARYLVLMLKGRPGTWKSAILKFIADVLDMVFIDLRLPTMDEVDLGVFPIATQHVHDGTNFPVIKMGIPEWAMQTLLNPKKYYLIVFEELNRTSPSVRNAAMGLLLERRIGPNFVFGDNVFMAATGNMGMADGTDVEEFDTALKSRIIPVTHSEELVEWLEAFAEDIKDKDGNIIRPGKVHQDIVEFLKQHPTEFYPSMKEQGSAKTESEVICNPRTWTGLSEAIRKNFGDRSTVAEYGDFVRTHGQSYVGPRILQFLKFMEENASYTLEDVVKGKVKDLTKIKRDNRAEILRTFEQFDPNTLKKQTEFDRLIEFIRSVDRDLWIGALMQFGQNRLVALNNKPGGARESELKKIFIDDYKYLAAQEDEEENKQKTK